MADHSEPVADRSKDSDRVNVPLLDASLLELLDALVDDRGRVAAAEALRVNYRTLAICHDSRLASPRMRRALEVHRDAADGHGYTPTGNDDTLGKLAALVEANGAMLETVKAQAKQWTELERMF